jgi:VWFA-related protein
VAPGYLVLYFDELFSTPAGRRQLITDLRTFLEGQLLAPERVLVLRQDSGLTVEVPLGSSRAELDAGLDRLARQPSTRGAQTWADERSALRNLQGEWERLTVLGGANPNQDPCVFFANFAFNEIQQHVSLTRSRISETLAHLTDTASFLAGLPGLKTVIYTSDGLTTRPGGNLLNFVRAICPGEPVTRRLDIQDGMSDVFRELTRHANANRVTIYTVQSLGLGQGTTLSTAAEKGVSNTFQAVGQYNAETRVQEREGLTFLARETGGRAVVDQNRFRGELEQIAQEMSSYYSLAYTPPHGGDGLEHLIEVKVRRDGLRVRHRPGYRDKSADERMLEHLESALVLNQMSNPLDVRLGAGEIKTGGSRKYVVPLLVVVPADRITFLPRKRAEVAKLKVQVMAKNERDGRTTFTEKIYDVARPPAGSQSLSLVLSLDLDEGVHVVAFGVRDEATQEASFVATGLDLRPPEEASAGG